MKGRGRKKHGIIKEFFESLEKQNENKLKKKENKGKLKNDIFFKFKKK